MELFKPLQSAMHRTMLLLSFVAALAVACARAQNVVEDGESIVLERRVLTAEELAALLDPQPKPAKAVALVVPEQKKLEMAIEELIDGWPWRPFFHQLGISGAETHFDHPEEMFVVVADAIRFLNPALQKKAREFLLVRLREVPPYATEGYDRAVGRARERYAVPDALRAKGKAKARDAWGVWATWRLYVATGDTEILKEHWPSIRARMQPLLANEYEFDPRKTDYAHDEAERLNGDLAGICATMYLSRLLGDEATFKGARERAGQLLQLRFDLERLNPRILNKTDAATKTLHHHKLARYLHLAGPVVMLLRQDGTAAKRLKPFREARPGWWMAFGDRYIGGENYTTSPDFAHALFTSGIELEAIPPQASAAWVDVPWCRGDLYQIGKITAFLQSTLPP
jgi:hypothetical protein